MKRIRLIVYVAIVALGATPWTFAQFQYSVETDTYQVESGAKPNYQSAVNTSEPKLGLSVTSDSAVEENTSHAAAAVEPSIARVRVRAEATTNNGDSLPMFATARASYANTTTAINRFTQQNASASRFYYQIIFRGGVQKSGSTSHAAGGVSYTFSIGEGLDEIVLEDNSLLFDPIEADVHRIHGFLDNPLLHQTLHFDFEIWAEARSGIDAGDFAIVSAFDSLRLVQLSALRPDGSIDPDIIFIGADGLDFSQLPVPEPTSFALAGFGAFLMIVLATRRCK